MTTDSVSDVAVGRAITGPDRDACSHTQTISPRRKALMQHVPRFLEMLTTRVRGLSARAANRNQLRAIVLDIAEQRGLEECWEWMIRLELGSVADHRLPDSAKGEIAKDLSVLINALHSERWGPPITERSAAELKFEKQQRLKAWRSRISALGEREQQQRAELRMRDALIAEQRRRSAHRTVPAPAPVLTPLEQRMEVAFDRLLDQELMNL
ncbi:hypothetical protein KR100_12000 [Synechococcus sp. KORDI-100]|uniref:hypothetical protein n=1 Tax=Synechococcus sp. KORDI-100 TaxID=1280380 RepID=UPI0004E0455E|nr:hypothetical protein [Synechococcus sp. KORDI-100]AII44072.1 hypothetical protein KR100_12000 [Synechococcus sp. KORDI-100]